MKRIIIHWTAGAYAPNYTDFEHYHYLVTNTGLVINGKYTPEDNLNCKDGEYAAHTEMGNTGNIGVALCGMKDYTENGSTLYPLTTIQCERAFKFIAELCKKYDIPVTPKTVLTHYEFDCNRGKPGRKIDIIHLHPYPEITKNKIGDFIREKISFHIIFSS